MIAVISAGGPAGMAVVVGVIDCHLEFIRIFFNFVFIDLHISAPFQTDNCTHSQQTWSERTSERNEKENNELSFLSTRDYIQDLAKEFLRAINLSVCPMYRMKQKRGCYISVDYIRLSKMRFDLIAIFQMLIFTSKPSFLLYILSYLLNIECMHIYTLSCISRTTKTRPFPYIDHNLNLGHDGPNGRPTHPKPWPGQKQKRTRNAWNAKCGTSGSPDRDIFSKLVIPYHSSSSS